MTFQNVNRFFVPSELCDECDAQLKEAGATGSIALVLWSGVLKGDQFVARKTHVPKQQTFVLGGLCLRVAADELHCLNVWLHEHEERLAIQVHSHPKRAFPTVFDEEFPIVTTLGGLSVIVPHFAQDGVRGPGTAIYQLANSGWQKIPASFASNTLQLGG